MNKVMLDTSAYSNFLAGDERVLGVVSGADTIYMSIFVLGELYAGFGGGKKKKENKQILHRFLTKPTVRLLLAHQSTAEAFGFLKNQLKTRGKPIPINDLWIASHAVESGSVLATYDRHFKYVPGLRLWDHI